MTAGTEELVDVDAAVRVFDAIVTTEEPGEAAHIVMVPPGEPDESPQAYVLRARIEQFTIEALCGYRFVPQRDPQALSPCEECVRIYRDSPHDDRNDLPDA